jgi:hypothetical protein
VCAYILSFDVCDIYFVCKHMCVELCGKAEGTKILHEFDPSNIKGTMNYVNGSCLQLFLLFLDPKLIVHGC